MRRTSSPAIPTVDFRILFESAPGLYLVLAPDLTIVAASGAYLRATMTRREEILGRPLFEVFPDDPDDPEATGVANLRASLERVIADRVPDAMAVQKYAIQPPDEEGGGFEERFWSPVNSPVTGENGELTFIIHQVEDVTDFLRLKHQGSEHGRIAAELRTRADSMEVESYQRAQQLQEANRNLRELHSDLEQRVQQRTADLERANHELQREIAERQRTEQALKESEEQLRQSQKLEAIGRLAGGVAHDFNNMLSVILSYSELAITELGEAHPRRADLLEIQRAGTRAADLTRQLLAFSRQQVLEPTILDANDVLGVMHDMLARVLGEDIELRLRLARDIGKVRADRGQLEQVIMNLVVNARDAMPNGGRLTIETTHAELDEVKAGVTPGRYLTIAVIDTGIGMDKVTEARIFEPFFTTKERGKGSGLGLSTVFGIVKQSGGNIAVHSVPGSGTTLRVYLPLVDAVEEVRTPAPSALKLPLGKETILLVEDEDQVRNVVFNILRRAGYRVVEARSPDEALLIAEKHPARIDLLATDVVMPRMNGRQVADRVRALRPGIKVLFMSGYTDDVVLHHGALDSAAVFVQKPITPDTLKRKVREALDAPAPS